MKLNPFLRWKIFGGILLALCPVKAVLAAAPLPPMLGTPEVVSADDYKWLEGARWDQARNRLLFTDPHGDTLYQLDQSGAVSVVRTPTRKANNIELDPQGRLVACEITGRVSRLSLSDGLVVDAVSDYAGLTPQFPNDLVILANGTIFFSDTRAPRIFRIDPNGRLHHALPDNAGDAGANGLALSPDRKLLYGAFSKDSELRVFDVIAPDRLSAPRKFATTEKTPDGLGVDRDGNIYVGTTAGVQVFSKTGEMLGVLPLPDLGTRDRVTKCVFGGLDGRMLFVLVPSKLFRVPAKIPGW